MSPTQFQKDHKPSHRFVTNFCFVRMASSRPLGGVVLFQIASVASRWGVILTTYSLGWSEGFHPTHLSATSQPALHRYLHRRKKENAMSFRVAQRRSLIEGSGTLRRNWWWREIWLSQTVEPLERPCYFPWNTGCLVGILIMINRHPPYNWVV